jgi:putative transposase
MLLQKKLLSSMVFPEKLSDYGQTKIKLNIKKQSVVTENIGFPIKTTKVKLKLTLKKKPLIPSFIPESHLKNKMQICLDKKNPLKTSLRKKNSDSLKFKISDQESILKERVCKPFWNTLCKEISKELWLPTKIDLLESDSTLLNGSLTNMELPSKLATEKLIATTRKTSKKTLSQYLPTIQQNITDPGNIKASLKIPIFPNRKSRKYFSKCISVSRWFYNKTIEFVNKERKPFNNLCNARKKVMPVKDKLLPSDESWKTEIYYDTRQLAVKEAVGSSKAAFTNKKNGNIRKFKLGYKSRKNIKQIFHISEKQIKFSNNKLIMFIKKDLQIRLLKRDRSKLNSIGGIQKSCKVQKVGRKWFVIVPYMRSTNFKGDKSQIISLDPGIRKFHSGYDPENQRFLKFGDRSAKLLKILENKINHLKSIRSRSNSTKRKKLRQKIRKLRTKAKGYVYNLHNQICVFLTSNYKNIVTSDLDTKSLLGSSLNRGSKTLLSLLSHGKFRERLSYHSKLRGSNVYFINESYTSKTCTRCGNLNSKSGKETIKCNRCDLVSDRDLVGSRNILIKFLSLSQALDGCL